MERRMGMEGTHIQPDAIVDVVFVARQKDAFGQSLVLTVTGSVEGRSLGT